MSDLPKAKCKDLVLDAGPLLSLSPLRGLAETYYTTPQVLAELKDNRAKEHFKKLGLLSGVKVVVKSPDASSLTNVIRWAKRTGDYSVLSHADMCVIALTHMLDEEFKMEVEKMKEEEKESETTLSTQTENIEASEVNNLAHEVENLTIDPLSEDSLAESSGNNDEPDDKSPTEGDDVVSGCNQQLEPLQVELHPIKDKEEDSPPPPTLDEPIPSDSDSDSPTTPPQPLYDDPSDVDDGEGEWITPQNVGIHKSRALDLLPDDEVQSKGGKGKGKKKSGEMEIIGAGCMTADFAMQNVLLQMGLNLVSVDGKRIQKVKNYVLRCHACFKICKDHSRKFCPSCGNPSLLRATVTISSPKAAKDAPVLQVHLKPNFQYRIRGTKYSIPAPKPGTAKTGPGEGLVLREDQSEWLRAKKHADGKREREESRLLKGMLSKGVEAAGNGGVSSWMDPNWMPEILSVGSGGKGRTVKSSKMDGDMPIIGYGKKNPNEKRRK